MTWHKARDRQHARLYRSPAPVGEKVEDKLPCKGCGYQGECSMDCRVQTRRSRAHKLETFGMPGGMDAWRKMVYGAAAGGGKTESLRQAEKTPGNYNPNANTYRTGTEASRWVTVERPQYVDGQHAGFAQTRQLLTVGMTESELLGYLYDPARHVGEVFSVNGVPYRCIAPGEWRNDAILHCDFLPCTAAEGSRCGVQGRTYTMTGGKWVVYDQS